jgi:hypothetical protein
MNERIRTILAVTVLTVAIWVWADLEQTAPPREVQLPVRVLVPPGYILRSVSPAEVTVRYTGPKGEVEKLSASADEMVCRLAITEQELRPLGEQELRAGRTLHARDGLGHWPHRILVTDLKGEHDGIIDNDIIVRLDRVVHVKVDVKPRVTGAEAEGVTAQPAQVEARVAESEWRSLPEAKRFALATLVVGSIPQDPQVVGEVPLERKLGGPDGIEATFDPPTVKVRALLKSERVTRSLGVFRIKVVGAPDTMNRYHIVFPQGAELAVDLEVRGPAPEVDRINSDRVSVVLELTADDKPNPEAWIPGKLKVLGLPNNVVPTRDLPTVNFNLEKKNDKPPVP